MTRCTLPTVTICYREAFFRNAYGDYACDRHLSDLWAATAHARAAEMRGER